MREVKEWVLAVKCPFCNKQLSLTEKYITLYKNQIYATCYNCNKKFIIKV